MNLQTDSLSNLHGSNQSLLYNISLSENPHQLHIPHFVCFNMYFINLMSMYYICFNVNVKSMGYKAKRSWNNNVIQIVSIRRISCRCGDGSIFLSNRRCKITGTAKEYTLISDTSSKDGIYRVAFIIIIIIIYTYNIVCRAYAYISFPIQLHTGTFDHHIIL